MVISALKCNWLFSIYEQDCGNGGVTINGGVANGQDGTSNGANGCTAIGAGSNANGGGIALKGGQTHTGCNVAIAIKCFNVPGK